MLDFVFFNNWPLNFEKGLIYEVVGKILQPFRQVLLLCYGQRHVLQRKKSNLTPFKYSPSLNNPLNYNLVQFTL